MAWKDLNIKQRAQLMSMMRQGGITTLKEMRHIYDGETEPTQSKERRKVGEHYLTLEQYKELQRDTIRQAAIQKALTRKEGVFPVINGEVGKSCIYTATDNFGRKYRVAGNQTFFANPEKYGFEVNGPIENARPGDLYQLFNNKGVPDHMNMITGEDANHNLLVSYSSGYAGFPNMNRGDYKVNAPMFDKAGYETYRFIGTPDDNALWEQQFNEFQQAPAQVGIPQVLNNRVEFAKGGKKLGPGGDKSVSLAPLLEAAKRWYRNPENKKKLALRLGAAAKQGAGLSPIQILMALADGDRPHYDELEAYLYGPDKFYEPYVGTSKGPLTEEQFQGVPQYRATINPKGEYIIPKDLKGLVTEAAKAGKNMYINGDTVYDEGSERFDASNHPVRFRYDNGNLVADAADMYDFDEGYVDRYSEKNNPIKKAILRKEIRTMQSVGNPYIVRQDGIPVRFAGEGNSEDYWSDDFEADSFERALMRGETGTVYNYKGTINNIRNRLGLPPAEFGKGGHKIHIKKANRGKFTALKKRTGKSASWFKAHGTPSQRKMATFALNARKWKHEHGGIKF